MGSWQEHLSWEAQRAHFHWDTTGRAGPGRMMLVGLDLSGAFLEGGYLHRVILRDCDLSRANLQGSGFEDAELLDVKADAARMNMADMDRIRVVGGSFVRTNFSLSHLDHSDVERADFGDAMMARATWDGARIRQARFFRAVLTDGRFEKAAFTGCSFEGADFSRTQPLPRAAGRAVAHDATFEDCDFSGANLDGLKLKGTRFHRCRFDGVRGRPLVDGPYVVTESTPDIYRAWGAPG